MARALLWRAGWLHGYVRDHPVEKWGQLFDIAHTTCRLQRRSMHAYLIDVLDAHTRGHPVPLLT